MENNNNKLKPYTLKQSIKLGLFIFFFCSIIFIAYLLIIIGGVDKAKEIIELKGANIINPIIYALILFFLIVSIGIFIGYKKEGNTSFTKKILTIQNPLITKVLTSFGINLNESNPKEFYFYYNILFGVILVISGIILFFVSGNYKMALILFIFGVITIVWGIIKRK